MSLLIPIMLFGWVPLTIYLFDSLKPHRAVLVAVIGGALLLPTTGYNWPGIPAYDKTAAISIGIILGGWFSGQYARANFSWKIFDLPMILWCLSPILTSLANELGLYDGLSNAFSLIMLWGIPYLSGRIYFRDHEALRDLCLGIVIGGMVYAVLCLYETRMSPQLNNIFYGFFPHQWAQHKRYGGWRPIVFMQHGLMVAAWMAAASTSAFWMWRDRIVDNIKGVPMGIIVALLILTTLLCKTAGGWFFLAVGCGAYFIHNSRKKNLLFLLLLSLVPGYIVMRVTGVVDGKDIEALASQFLDFDRISSLAIRLVQEDLFSQKALERPIFGWGTMSRGWPSDLETGKSLIGMVDSLWIITLSSKGLFGLFSLTVAMLIGPWCTFRASAKHMPTNMPIMLSLIVVLFMIDCLFNAMVNPIYIMCTGALVSFNLIKKDF